MRQRGFTMLEMLLSVVLLSAFVAVYVAWSTAALRFTRAIDDTGGEILADRALDYIVRDYRDRVPASAFEGEDEQTQEEAAAQAEETGEAEQPLQERQPGGEPGEEDPSGEHSPQGPQDETAQGTQRLAVTRHGAESFGLDTDRVEIISPHWAPGQAPGFYEVEYYLRDGSLWRRARPLDGSTRRLTVTQSGSTSGDELEMLRNVQRFEIQPVDEEQPGAGTVITLELELETGEIISRRRIVEAGRSRR